MPLSNGLQAPPRRQSWEIKKLKSNSHGFNTHKCTQRAFPLKTLNGWSFNMRSYKTSTLILSWHHGGVGRVLTWVSFYHLIKQFSYSVVVMWLSISRIPTLPARQQCVHFSSVLGWEQNYHFTTEKKAEISGWCRQHTSFLFPDRARLL